MGAAGVGGGGGAIGGRGGANGMESLEPEVGRDVSLFISVPPCSAILMYFSLKEIVNLTFEEALLISGDVIYMNLLDYQCALCSMPSILGNGTAIRHDLMNI